MTESKSDSTTDTRTGEDGYPVTADGELDYDQMLDEMGFKTDGHPVVGKMHRMDGDLVEVHGERFGELQLETREYGTYEQDILLMYDEWRDGEFEVTPVKEVGLAKDETVVKNDTLSTLAAFAATADTVPTDVRDAIETLTETLGADAVSNEPDRLYGLFATDPQDPHTTYTMLGDPVRITGASLSDEELLETVRDRVLTEHDFQFSIPESEDLFVAELAAFPDQ